MENESSGQQSSICGNENNSQKCFSNVYLFNKIYQKKKKDNIHKCEAKEIMRTKEYWQIGSGCT